MNSILETILEHKREIEVPARKKAVPLDSVRRLAEQTQTSTRNFAAALNRTDGKLALIAEVKRASPSKGVFIHGDFDPMAIAIEYERTGAAAISVLTDEKFFQGHLDFLTRVKNATNIPVLRKDFIVDAYQLYEARAAGADAALLIVAALDDISLKDLRDLALELKLTPLIEVHDEAETERALKIGAEVIGVNNRDLRTFVVDIQTTKRCLDVMRKTPLIVRHPSSVDIPSFVGHPLVVSESGIFSAKDARIVAEIGACAILVGESIITSKDRPHLVRELANISRSNASTTYNRQESNL
jgi:indole-3-glycerol phosphate synthase